MATKTMPLPLSAEDAQILKQLLTKKTLPWQILKRLEAIRLLAKGLSQSLVAKQLCVRREIIYTYRKTYLEGGITALIKMEKPGKETLLTEEMAEAVEAYRDQKQKRVSNKELCAWLFEKYQVTISPEWLSKRLTMREELKKGEPWK